MMPHFQNHQAYIQRLCKPFAESGAPLTLENLLQSALVVDASEQAVPAGRVITHGIEVPLDTPLQWMSEHLSYPDNFLHLCYLPNASGSV